jgi:hypothetical protein
VRSRLLFLEHFAAKAEVAREKSMNDLKRFSPEGLGNRFRLKRLQLFQRIIDEVISEKQRCRIIDVGGTVGYWETFGRNLDWTKVEVTILNLTASKTTLAGIATLAGDARDLKQFNDLSFDIVHSNSVIEHVGRWDDMGSMANEVRRLAARYFVQTPYFWFPIEPHARFPFLHWMPESWRYRILMYRTCGYWQRRADVGSATKAVQSAVLIDRKQMQFLFPDARIVSERFFGLTKSLNAIRA